MAYSTLLSLERTINQILDHDRFSIPPFEEKLIISLDKCVISFQAFLEHFPEKAKDLEGRIRDVATEADDIIEWFLQEQIRYAYRHTKWIAILRGIMFKYHLGKLRDEMESIAEQVVEITNTIIIKDVQPGDSVAATSSSQVEDTGQANIVGFSKDMIEIMEKLCGREPQLQVIPIFGMGGIGKTTLARNAYDEQLVIEHFQIRAWMTISQNYSPRQILLDLLDSIKEFEPNWRKESMAEDSEKCDDNMVERFEQSKESPREIIEQSQVEISDQSNSKMAERYEHGTESLAKTVELSNSEIALKVHKILIGRRFLIVIDDIWSRKVLDDVKHLFPNENKGSRIILTTRLTEVATYANSTLPHKMRLMDAHQSWNLLRQKVFGSQDPIPHELEIIGWEIARSCGGLPLAIVVIAGVLSTMSKTQSSWKKVAKNIRSSLVITDGQIEKILSLSYNHLPHHLRSCFMHVGGFPEDHEIKATDLIRLWIAESFVKPVVLKEFEVIAEEYLEDLVDRSLIIVTKRKSNGKIKCCGLHDMVREMCIKIAEKEKFLVHVNGRQASKVLKSFQDQRRISIYDSDLYTFSNISSSTIRTIIYFQCDGLDSFGSFRLLGILDLLGVRYTSKSVSDQVFELFHLRYLAFRYSYPVPRAISNLQSLQTLIMKGYMHERLPYEIWNLRKLRHFIFSGSYLAFSDDDALENLQSLGLVDNLFCSISNLNKIQNIKKLWLRYDSYYGELLFHNLVHLNQLEKLHLELRESRREDYGNPNLVLPPSLKKLTLIGWGKSEPYLHIVGPFPNLEVLKLKSFNFSPQVWRTTDGDFPQLKFLLIEKSDIEEWETESSHFPRLKTLLIHSCMDLTEIPECIGEIPTLELIEVKLCLESLAKSARWIQKEAAESYGDDDVFQVRCIDCKPPPSPPRQTQPTVSSHRRVNYPKKPRLPEPRLTRPLTYMLRYPKRYNKLFKRT